MLDVTKLTPGDWIWKPGAPGGTSPGFAYCFRKKRAGAWLEVTALAMHSGSSATDGPWAYGWSVLEPERIAVTDLMLHTIVAPVFKFGNHQAGTEVLINKKIFGTVEIDCRDTLVISCADYVRSVRAVETRSPIKDLLRYALET